MGLSILKLTSLVVACMVLGTLMNPHATEAAITCGAVTKSLAPCMSYLSGTSRGLPPANCCAGARSLQSMAQSPGDRRAACDCMKKAAAKMKNLNYGAASRLPGQCGLRMRYTFSPNTNCNTVQ